MGVRVLNDLKDLKVVRDVRGFKVFKVIKDFKDIRVQNDTDAANNTILRSAFIFWRFATKPRRVVPRKRCVPPRGIGH